LRLQAEALGIRSEINELQRDMNERQRDLKTLLNITTPSHIVLTATVTNTKPPEELAYGNLFNLADASRPDLKEAMFQKEYFEKSLRYERAQRTPDLALSAAYDRAGGVGRNFVGFGVSMDLPFFDRNQGNIRAAQISIQQSQTLIEKKQLEVRNEVIHAMQNYTLAYDFNRQIADEFISELDKMLENYRRHFINRNIGIVEFLDFFEAYKDNKNTILEAQKDLKISFEELQYAVGTEL
jgi:cobalt-zinc-cadmium efflux system outer membrane protein